MSLDLSPFPDVVIVTWVELDGAVEVGQGLVVASHGPECFSPVGDGPVLVSVEFGGAVEVGQGLVVAPHRLVCVAYLPDPAEPGGGSPVKYSIKGSGR